MAVTGGTRRGAGSLCWVAPGRAQPGGGGGRDGPRAAEGRLGVGGTRDRLPRPGGGCGRAATAPAPAPTAGPAAWAARPLGGGVVPVPSRLSQRWARPAAAAGGKALQSGGQAGAARLGRARLCAQVPRGSGRTALRERCSPAPRYAAAGTRSPVLGTGAQPMRGRAASARARTRGGRRPRGGAPGAARECAGSGPENIPRLCMSRGATARARSRAARSPERSRSGAAPRPRSPPKPAQLPRRLQPETQRL